jgi:hypothetical protein
MMSVYIRYHVHSLSGLLVTAMKLFVKGNIPWHLKLLLCIVESVMLRGWYCAESFYCLSLLDLLVLWLSVPPLKFCTFATGVLISP